VRHIDGEEFQVFAINCAHLGCPVRWFPQSELFMCPCHGGAYYSDGSRASGPPERGLFEYPYKVQDGLIAIHADEPRRQPESPDGRARATLPAQWPSLPLCTFPSRGDCFIKSSNFVSTEVKRLPSSIISL